MRILAIQLKRIGDLVLTTPALAAMRAAGHDVTLALTETTAALLPALAASVDRGLVYRRAARPPLWRELLRGPRFDAVIDFTGRDRSALLTACARAPQRVVARPLLRGSRWRPWIYNRPVETAVRGRHTVDFHLDQLAALGIPVTLSAEPAGPILHLPADAFAQAANLLAGAGIAADQRYVVVHPGTARPEKYWRPEGWAEVIRSCQQDLGLPVVLTGGMNDPTEDTHLAQIRSALSRGPGPFPAADLAGRLDLLTLAAVLARAALVLGVDSGPMHLAAAFQRPQVVLFGPTNPFHWRPRHAFARVLRAGHGDAPLSAFSETDRGGATGAISTAAVIGCIKSLLPAGPPA